MERRRRPNRRGGGARPGDAGRRNPGQPTRPRRALSQKLAPRQAGIAQPAIRVQDSHLRRSPGWREPIPGHADLDPLPHHVSPQSNPRSAAQLQPQRSDLAEGTGQSGGKARRLQDEHLDAGSTSQGSQSAESLRHGRCRYPGSLQGPRRQVQQQHVHRSVLEEHRRHRQRLLQRIRRQDDEPVQLDAPSHGLDRIQASGQIQIGRDPSRGLDLGHRLQRERRHPAGPLAAQGSGRGAWQPAQSEDRIQSPKAGGYRPIRSVRQAARRARRPVRVEDRTRPRRHRQRPHDLDSP